MTKTNHGTEIPPPDPAFITCAECGEIKSKHFLVLGKYYCYEFNQWTDSDQAIAEFRRH